MLGTSSLFPALSMTQSGFLPVDQSSVTFREDPIQKSSYAEEGNLTTLQAHKKRANRIMSRSPDAVDLLTTGSESQF